MIKIAKLNLFDLTKIVVSLFIDLGNFRRPVTATSKAACFILLSNMKILPRRRIKKGKITLCKKGILNTFLGIEMVNNVCVQPFISENRYPSSRMNEGYRFNLFLNF